MTNSSAQRLDALAEAPLLRGASEHVLAQLCDAGCERRLPARDWLFRSGEPSDRLFVVLSGRLQVVDADGRVLRELGAGAALGELGLLTGSARSASVRAVRDSRLLELDAERFGRLVEDDRGLALSIARELARQLQERAGSTFPRHAPPCSPSSPTPVAARTSSCPSSSRPSGDSGRSRCLTARE